MNNQQLLCSEDCVDCSLWDRQHKIRIPTPFDRSCFPWRDFAIDKFKPYSPPGRKSKSPQLTQLCSHCLLEVVLCITQPWRSSCSLFQREDGLIQRSEQYLFSVGNNVSWTRKSKLQIVQVLARGTSVFWRLFKVRGGLKCSETVYFQCFWKWSLTHTQNSQSFLLGFQRKGKSL